MAETKRIALIVPSLSGGGAEKIMVRLANCLSKVDSVVVDLIVFQARSALNKDVDSKVNIHVLNKESAIRAIPAIITYVLVKKPFRILSTLNYVNFCCIFVGLITGNGRRTVVREATTPSMAYKKLPVFKKTIFSFATFFLYRFSNKVICVSSGVSSDLRKNFFIPSKKLETILNPFDIEETLQLANQPAEFPWILHSEKIICAIGRLEKVKGFDLLIAAFSKLLPRYPEIRLVIIGDGSERKNLEAQIRDLKIVDQAKLLGFDANPYRFLSKSNVFVLSSRYEGCPNVLIEALGLGVPSVSFNCQSGPSDFFGTHELRQFLANPEDVEDLAGKIELAICVPLEKGSYQKTVDKLAPAIIIQKYLTVLGINQ